MPQIEVSFDIDANGILNVSAKDKGTGKQQSIVIKANSGLSDKEIEKMVRDAEANAEADKKFEEMVTARNQAETLAHAARKTLQESGDKASAEEKAAIEAALKDIDAAVKGDSKEAIEAATKKLSDASAKLAEKLYAEQAAQAQPAGGAEQPQEKSAGNEDALDAEFEEVKDDKK